MYYGNIKPFSIENGPGVRVSLFVSGCRNHCRNCFSSHTWDFQYGALFDEAAQEMVMRELDSTYCAGLTVLGGEPMEPENQRDLLPFLRKVRGKYPQKTIWIYTGFVLIKTGVYNCGEASETRSEPSDRGRGSSGDFSFSLLDTERTDEDRDRANTEVLGDILALTDVLVDGRFVEEEKSLLLAFRGSENQRIIDVKRTLAEGEIRLCEKWMKGTR